MILAQSKSEVRRTLHHMAKSSPPVFAAICRSIAPPSSLVSSSLPPAIANASNAFQLRLQSTTSTPFYGEPLPPSSRYTNTSPETEQQPKNQHPVHNIPPLTPLQRLTTLVHSSLTALNDPTRADAVAAVGEVTGSFALSNIMRQMEKDPIGRRILKERPLVDEKIAERAMELWRLENGYETTPTTTTTSPTTTTNTHKNSKIDATIISKSKPKTFGAAYAKFLLTHHYHPNERDPIRYISDPNLAYVMTRYRQCHDYWHALTELPPSVVGELGLKWLELFQTGMPLAALSVMSASLGPGNGALGGVSGLSSVEREVLWEVYYPWAVRVGRQMKGGGLMCVYYEEELETDLEVLRERLGIEAAPIVEF